MRPWKTQGAVQACNREVLEVLGKCAHAKKIRKGAQLLRRNNARISARTASGGVDAMLRRQALVALLWAQPLARAAHAYHGFNDGPTVDTRTLCGLGLKFCERSPHARCGRCGL